MLVKQNLSDLAIRGGPPAFTEPLHVGAPNLPDRERLFARIGQALDRRWLSNDGEFVREFEREVARRTKVKHCIATASGTAALDVVIRAAGLTGEVIVPSLTFIATPHALAGRGITPVFADVAPETLCIDPAHVESLITPRTTGILGVHLWGRPCDTNALHRIAERHGLSLLFDAAHAFGCEHRDKPIGNFGRAEVFSFHATKFVNAAEGGAIVTNDDELANQARLIRNFGFADVDQVETVGTNAKLNELCAAVGLTTLEQMDDIVRVNRSHYESYARHLAGIPGVTLLEITDREPRNFQHVVLRIDAATAGISRDQLAGILQAENVLARRYYYPGCHRAKPYAAASINRDDLRVTETVLDEVLTLPTGSAIQTNDVERIAHLIRFIVAHSGELGGNRRPLAILYQSRSTEHVIERKGA